MTIDDKIRDEKLQYDQIKGKQQKNLSLQIILQEKLFKASKSN